MKYITPMYEISNLESEEILTASFEIEESSDGSGKIKVTASNLFG